jgi:hypothetical protein
LRIAALIFGLLAGMFGGGVIAFGNLESGLAALTALGSHRELIAKFIVYAIPNIGLLGAGLAIARPRWGGVFMLLSALAWVAVAVVAGHGAVFFAALPFTFVGAGGLVALWSRRSDEPDPEADEAPAPEPVDLPWPEEAEAEEEPPAPVPPPRRTGRQAPPLRVPEPEPEPEPEAEPEDLELYDELESDEPAEPEFADELDLDEDQQQAEYDDEDAEPPFEADADETDDESEPIAEEDFAPDDTDGDDEATDPEDEDAAPEEPVVDLSGAPFEFDFTPENRRVRPEPEPLDEEDEDPPPPPPRRGRESAAYAAERQSPPPSRRQSAPLPPASRDGRRARPTAEFIMPTDEYPTPPLEPEPRRKRQRSVERTAPPDPAILRPRRSRVVPIVNLVLILVLLGVAGGALYWDYLKGPQSFIFGSHPPHPTAKAVTPATPAAPRPTPTVAATPRPVAPVVVQAPAPPTPAPAATPSVDTPVAPAPPVVVAATPAPTPLASSPPAATVAASPSPAAPDSPAIADTGGPPPDGADPFKYCAAVNTVDAPDARFAGPPVPAVIVAALPGGTAIDQIHWRCSSQSVYVCNANHGAACDLTPTVDTMVAFCAIHPNTESIPAPNGFWSCNGKRPAIPADQQWPVDARGYYPGAWARVPPPGAG